MKGLAAVGVAFFVYAAMASRLERVWISAPMFFVAVGVALGPDSLGWVAVLPGVEAGRVFTEIILAVLLFADASTISLNRVRDDAALPARLLLLGLPLTIVLGTVAGGLLFPDIGWAGAALLASILAPTDAALGTAVVTNPVVPVRIRRALNVESGLNDGIAAPFVTLFLTLVTAEETHAVHWAVEAAKEIGVAVVVAVLVGVAGGWVIDRARRRGWTTPVATELAVLALALLSYAGSVSFGGNGFVAAFVAGIVFGATTRGALAERTEFTETAAMFGSFVVWALFGAGLAGPVLAAGLHVEPLVYALLSLTVIRMVPVALALFGTGLRRDTVLFMGWFGPRGLASVVFTLFAFSSLPEHGLHAVTILEVATYTILLSVVAHGLSAAPLSKVYGARSARAPAHLPEHAPSPEPRVRRRTLAG